MSNLSDYVKDYYDRYPWFSAIFPNITHNGLNVSHRVGILRQACWILKHILESKVNITDDGNTFIESRPVGGALPLDHVKAGGFDGLTQEDLSLLGVVLRQTDILLRNNNRIQITIASYGVAIDDTRYENYINFINNIESNKNPRTILINKRNDPTYRAIMTAATTVPGHLADTAVGVGGLPAVYGAINAAIAGAGVGAGNAWTDINTVAGAAAVVYAGGAAAAAGSYLALPTITPRHIGDYIATHIFHNSRRCAPAIALASHQVQLAVPYNTPPTNLCLRTLLYHFIGSDNLNMKIVNSLAKLACIQTEKMAAAVPVPAIPATLFNAIIPLPSKNHYLFDRTLNDLLGFAIADRVNYIGDSVSIAYLNSFKMYKDNLVKQDNSSTYFVKNDTGGLVLMNGTQAYNYDDIVTNDNFCTAFGAGNIDDGAPNGVNMCAGLFDVCLRGDNTDKEACKAEFKKLSKATQKLNAWVGKTPKQKQMLAYNVLNGLGFTALNKRGGLLTFSHLDDRDIYTRLDLDLNNQVDKEKVSYIRNLINLVGDIQLNVTKTQSALPLHVYNDTPLVNSFNPVLVYSPLYSGLAGGALIGGNPGYGVAQHALNDITNINGILNKLGKTMSERKISEIQEKLSNYLKLAKDIDTQRIVLDKHLIAKSVVNADDLVLTEQEALLISDKLAKDNEAFIKKSAKIDRLGYKLVAVMP